MLEHKDSRILPQTPTQLYDLVSDVEEYPNFIPGCLACHVVNAIDAHKIRARMTVGHGIFKESFECDVQFTPKEHIEVSGAQGVLSHLLNQWTFEEDGHGCRVTFLIEFKFNNFMVETMFRGFFDQAAQKIMVAFEKRAAEIYGSAN